MSTFVVIANTVTCPREHRDAVVQAYQAVIGTMDAPGFLSFFLLEASEPHAENQKVISFTFWTNEQAFGNWRRSPKFEEQHRSLGEQFGDLQFAYSVQKYKGHLSYPDIFAL